MRSQPASKRRMTTMSTPLKLITVLLMVHSYEAFQPSPRRSGCAVLPWHQSPPSPRRSHHLDLSKTRCPPVQMTSTEEQDKSSLLSPPPPSDLDDSTGGGLKRTLLLAIPLFCKFVVVLLIKFVTDAIVFPLLFLYRLAHITKRKIKLLFKKKDDATPSNGDLSPPSNE